MQSKIGFIGLGSMGKPMAANIAKAGFELTVYDLREEPCKALAALGAKVAASPREVAEKSDIIEIAVVDDAQAEQVVAGEHAETSSFRYPYRGYRKAGAVLCGRF